MRVPLFYDFLVCSKTSIYWIRINLQSLPIFAHSWSIIHYSLSIFAHQFVHLDEDDWIAFTMEDLFRTKVSVLGPARYGTMYKAMLEDGRYVAVRRFRKNMTKGHREFKFEAEVLGKIQHHNLLGIRACYMEQDRKLIIFDYMPKGSLYNLLHGKTS